MQAARGTSLNDVDPTPAVRPSRTPARLIFLGIVVVMLVLDQVTKAWAVDNLHPGEYRDVVGELLRFTLVRNPGASFGMGTEFTEVIAIIAIVATCVTVWFALRTSRRWWAVALGFLGAGVVGNLIDRIWRPPGQLGGHVIDFLALPNWPVFNIADICVNIAAVLILVLAWRGVPLDGTTADAVDGPDEASS